MDWWHTANLLAQNANLHRSKNSPAVDPTRLNPFSTKKQARQATPEELAKLFGPDWHEVKTQ